MSKAAEGLRLSTNYELAESLSMIHPQAAYEIGVSKRRLQSVGGVMSLPGTCETPGRIPGSSASKPVADKGAMAGADPGCVKRASLRP
jgi:hypothetical protein